MSQYIREEIRLKEVKIMLLFFEYQDSNLRFIELGFYTYNLFDMSVQDLLNLLN